MNCISHAHTVYIHIATDSLAQKVDQLSVDLGVLLRQYVRPHSQAVNFDTDSTAD